MNRALSGSTFALRRARAALNRDGNGEGKRSQRLTPAKPGRLRASRSRFGYPVRAHEFLSPRSDWATRRQLLAEVAVRARSRRHSARLSCCAVTSACAKQTLLSPPLSVLRPFYTLPRPLFLSLVGLRGNRVDKCASYQGLGLEKNTPPGRCH
ncbi:hypothetical protein MRX96_027269 [Rhipicephalus microplus]